MRREFTGVTTVDYKIEKLITRFAVDYNDLVKRYPSAFYRDADGVVAEVLSDLSESLEKSPL